MDLRPCFSFATILAANFGCNQLGIMPEIVYKLKTQASEVAVLFSWNLSSLPFLGCVVYLDLLLCTGLVWYMLICFYAVFVLRVSETNEE